MWTEDSEPKDVGGKVYPRYFGIIERLWGGTASVRERAPRQTTEVARGGLPWNRMAGGSSNHAKAASAARSLDEERLDVSSYEAAHSHCTEAGPLRREFEFKCGRFSPSESGRSPTWAGAKATANMDLYGKGFSVEKALDDDEETYFWAIAPKEREAFEVSWRHSTKDDRLGKWFRKITAATGAVDRPGDRLLKGNLMVQQWLPANHGSGYHLKWNQIATFVDGTAVGEDASLLDGPVVSVKVECTEYQVQWMALREITAEPGTPREHPVLADLPPPRAPTVSRPGVQRALEGLLMRRSQALAGGETEKLGATKDSLI